MINPEELLVMVDENDNEIGIKSRTEIHLNNYWHRGSIIFIKNNRNQILCHKRSILKDSDAGLWQPYFGGHVNDGENYETNAVNELFEELGIRININDLNFYKSRKSESKKHFAKIYFLNWDKGDDLFNIEQDEVEEIKWLSFEELEGFWLDLENQQWTHYASKEEAIELLNSLKFKLVFSG